MKIVHFILGVFLFVVINATSSCDRCQNYHPQSIICQSDFVGMVKITKVNLENVINLLPSNNVTAEIKILEVFKGSREDFVEGSLIYLYAPSELGCQRKYWKEDILITGRAFNGGLLSTKCDLREARSILTKNQLTTISSHIRNHAYSQGCSSCTIKQPYDLSPLQRNECRYQFDESPISTSACMKSEVTGRCRFVRKSRQLFRLPDQPELPAFRDFDENRLSYPKERGCLLDRINSEALKLPRPVEEELETTSASKTTPSVAIASSKNIGPEPVMRMSINWSKRRLRIPRT